MKYNVPILLITFNRPKLVRKVLLEIKKIQPKSLYIFQDGPRKGVSEDILLIQEVRSIIKELVDWPCNLVTMFQNVNLGCGRGPATAIEMFFSHEERGIILEDDCMPHPDFFEYCEELLILYQEDKRISFIGGCNYNFPINFDYSYAFMGGHHQTWGWATWKRTWDNFDYYLTGWDEKKIKSVIKHYYKDFRQRIYWLKKYRDVKKNRMNDSCWDYQFYFSCWEHHQLAICPSVNLVSNVGYGEDATHTKSEGSDLLSMKTQLIIPISHPKQVEHKKQIDDFMMKRFIIPYCYGKKIFIHSISVVNLKIKKILNHKGPWIKRKTL